MAIAFTVLLVQLAVDIFLLYMCIAFLWGAPFVPTNNASASAMIALARIRRGDVVYDLGSGNGKLLRLATKQGARAIGYEINPFLVLWANLRGDRTIWKNFWHADISDADIIFIYLLPSKMARLAEKIQRECKAGTIIVSNSFIFPDWNMLRQDRNNHIYVFSV